MMAKLGIVEEEADEVLFWLELILEERLLAEPDIRDLRRECNEVLSMVVASIKTLRKPPPSKES